MSGNPVLVWFRQDLRIDDNTALAEAARSGQPVIPIYLWPETESAGDWTLGTASGWWLVHSLRALDLSLQERGSKLILRKGDPGRVLPELVAETGTDALYFNNCYEPQRAKSDLELVSSLTRSGLVVKRFNSSLLFEPDEVVKADGAPYRVFTPFWKRCLSLGKSQEPSDLPEGWPSPEVWPESITLEQCPDTQVYYRQSKLSGFWTPGEQGARDQFDRFLRNGIDRYGELRDRPDLEATSSLSPHLHFGELGPRQIWRALQEHTLQQGLPHELTGCNSFLRELGWREFAYHALHHYPHSVDHPLKEEFFDFPWRDDAKDLEAWQKGLTGYPLVDAGMRQLASMGWIHNRVRMVVASFVVKHLLLPWQEGSRWFWDKLVDADLACNTLGWQWAAGCGVDAAPYFRVFNPVSQGERHDPQGNYVRRWVPELERLPHRWVHRPWEAPKEQLSRARVSLGQDYPLPIVDHSVARQRALDAFGQIKRSKKK